MLPLKKAVFNTFFYWVRVSCTGFRRKFDFQIAYYPFRKKLTFFLEGIATLLEMKLKNQFFRTEFDFTYEIDTTQLLPIFSPDTPHYKYT